MQVGLDRETPNSLDRVMGDPHSRGVWKKMNTLSARLPHGSTSDLKVSRQTSVP